MRGRKPKPTELKRLEGNPGKRALPDDEPQPEIAIPDCPAHLDAEAQAEWHRITAELQAVGTVARLYRGPLAVYCAAWSRWIAAEKQIVETGGEIVKSPSGFPIQNPHRAIANKAALQVQSLAAEFGMTPSSKSRIRAVKTETKSALKLFASKRA